MSKKFWKDIWDKKGNSDSTDLLYLDGYEHLEIDFSSRSIVDNIIDLMEIKPGESILEVACGAGFLARELQDYDYTGVDYSELLIKKHKDMFPGHNVSVAESNSLPFLDESYDNVFCFGLFQYLPDNEYAEQTIAEMLRVSRDRIFLGDLKSEATRKEHFVYPKGELIDQSFRFSPCVYNFNDVERYNAFKCKK